MRARLALVSQLSEGGLVGRLLGLGDDESSRRVYRRLLVIVAVGAALRLAWVLFAARDPQGLVDPSFYRRYAEQLTDGDGYVLVNGEPTAYYPIGYPAALAAVFSVVLHTPLPDDLALATGLFQLALGLATVVLTFVVGCRLIDERVGLVAAGIVAVFPNLIFHTAVPLTETLFIFLLMAALAVILAPAWTEDRPTIRRLAVFGVLLGLSILVRPISLLLLPAALVAWLVAGVGWRRAVFRTLAAGLAASAIIAPWTVRNLIVMDSLVFVSANLGDNLCIGNQAEATGGFVVTDACFGHNEDVPNPEGEIERDAENRRRAVDYALGHPVDEVRLLGWKALRLFEDDHDGLAAAESYGNDPFLSDRSRTLLAAVADGFFYAVAALAVLGAPFVVSRREPRRLFFALSTLGLTLVPLAFFGDPRFHVPSLPLAAVFAAAALSVLLESPDRRQTEAGPSSARP